LKQVHPLGKSPVIEDDGRVVAESGAIIDYILRRHGNGRLQPAASEPRYDDYVHWMHYAEGSAMPALIVRINVARVGNAAAAMLPRLDAEIALQLTYINGVLDGRPYILGEDLTAADIQLSFVGELAAGRFGVAEYATIKGFEVMHAIRKRQTIPWQIQDGVRGEVRLIERAFGIGECVLAEIVQSVTMKLAYHAGRREMCQLLYLPVGKNICNAASRNDDAC
jgi:glutathione S-transferase